MKRATLTEGKSYDKTVSVLAKELSMSTNDLIAALYTAENYIRNRLNVAGTLQIDRDKFSFSRIAGVFPVSTQLEIEVIPKFLSESTAWRSEFLQILARTRWGILSNDRVVSVTKSKGIGLNESLALVYLAIYDKVSHIPIRVYKCKRVCQFAIEGDLEEESLLVPEQDGFTQTLTTFTEKNIYNSIISKAAKTLLETVQDFNIRARLTRAIQNLGNQDEFRTDPPKLVPARFRNWQTLYDLSKDILSGYGIDYMNQGDIISPGLLVRTSDAWEEFLRQALVKGLPDCSVAYQEGHLFAKRDRTNIKVKPDYVIRGFDGSKLLADAKYKYGDAVHGSVSNSDIYEGWAFMKATGISRLALLYPYNPNISKSTFEQFQRISDGDKEIVAIRVNPEKVSSEGLRQFGRALGDELRPLFIHEPSSLIE